MMCVNMIVLFWIGRMETFSNRNKYHQHFKQLISMMIEGRYRIDKWMWKKERNLINCSCFYVKWQNYNYRILDVHFFLEENIEYPAMQNYRSLDRMTLHFVVFSLHWKAIDKFLDDFVNETCNTEHIWLFLWDSVEINK